MKKDFTPTILDFGPVQFYLARHFGFCYGVENAIDIAFRIIEENPDKRIFLLSEMIHNPQVNADLQSRGVRFLQNTEGKQIIPFHELAPDDVVIIPAFGTSLETEALLKARGIHTATYNTTCPFVEKVWNRSAQIAQKDFTVIVHGKPEHEETRATFSHAALNAPALVIKNMDEAKILSQYILGEKDVSFFHAEFSGRYTVEFDAIAHLKKIGVVNQTTMLASDTQAIAEFLRQTMIRKYGSDPETIREHFADTRDTLCYATNDNQTAVTALLETKADLAIIVGGYNSSNTSHLVELCEEKLPAYFISSEEKVLSSTELLHYDLHGKREIRTSPFLPDKSPAKILVTSGASCPDALVEGVLYKIAGYFPGSKKPEEILQWLNAAFN